MVTLQQADDDGFEGLSLHEHLPFLWEPSDLGEAAELEQCGQETARALQAIALFEEAPREPLADAGHHQEQELAHLEAKVDVLLSLVTRLVADRHGAPERTGTVLRADSLEWSGPAAGTRGARGYRHRRPLPERHAAARLPPPARVAGVVDRSGSRWILTRFEHIPSPVHVGLEKLIFRRHRRRSRCRGTDVLSRTGVFSGTGLYCAPKADVSPLATEPNCWRMRGYDTHQKV